MNYVWWFGKYLKSCWVLRQLRNFPVYKEESHENFKAVKSDFSAVIQPTNRELPPLEKHTLKPQEDKVKLVLWETRSDEAGCNDGFIDLRFPLNFMIKFRGATIFQKFRNYLKILGVIKLLWSQLNAEDSHILGANVTKFIRTGEPGFCASLSQFISHS
jgi:hypothetical protein